MNSIFRILLIFLFASSALIAQKKNPIKLADSSIVSKSIIVDYNGDLWNAGDVYIQDQTTPSLYFLFTEQIEDVTLAYTATRGSDSITLVAGHNCTIDDILNIFEGAVYFQANISAISGDNLTLSKYIPYSFSTDATVEHATADMNVNASDTIHYFRFYPKGNNSYDIYMISASLVHSTEADNSKFGNIAELTNGLIVGKVNPALVYDSWPFNFKKNADFGLYSFTVEYTDKAGGGEFGTDIKKNFRETTGVVPRVLPGQYIEIVIRDNLSTLSSFQVGILGHIVTNY